MTQTQGVVLLPEGVVPGHNGEWPRQQAQDEKSSFGGNKPRPHYAWPRLHILAVTSCYLKSWVSDPGMRPRPTSLQQVQEPRLLLAMKSRATQAGRTAQALPMAQTAVPRCMVDRTLVARAQRTLPHRVFRHMCLTPLRERTQTRAADQPHAAGQPSADEALP